MDATGRKRILIATTGGRVTRHLFICLKSCRDFEIVWVDNGEAAVEAVEAQPFDLVFMDRLLFGMDGWTAARRIRTLERGRDVPMIALLWSSANETRDAEAALADGWNGYLGWVMQPIVAQIVERFLPEGTP